MRTPIVAEMGQLQTRPGPVGTRFGEIRHFDEIDSTNRRLLEDAKGGLGAGAVVAAEHQTAGRGRLDRTWIDEPGSSLLFSILFEPSSEMFPFRLVQVVSLAVIDACRIYAGFEAQLKWPNDVIVDGRKLAGILAESNASDGEVDQLVVGCGLNFEWDRAPRDLDSLGVITASEAAGISLDKDSMLDAILRAAEERLARPSWIPMAYAMRCATIGAEVRVEIADGMVEGLAKEVTVDGALVVESADAELRMFYVGDITHLR